MGYQTVFRRVELKYLLTEGQRANVLRAMEPYMERDAYGRTVIRNLYFDTEQYRMIRRSIEKPTYKEKLRLRSYALAEEDSTVFVELKKKYDHVVYKRRMAMTERQAMGWLCGGQASPTDSQIAREIDYVTRFYGDLRPTVFLSYAREAYFCRDGGTFRVTFDDEILCRRDGLSLTLPPGGEPILASGMYLMELKCVGGIPLWMTRALSEQGLYKTSFSKYGTAYERLILPELLHEKNIRNTKKDEENFYVG